MFVIKMTTNIFLIWAALTTGVLNLPTDSRSDSLQIISREEWGAQPPTGVTPLNLPVPFVVLHHSSEPGICYTDSECQRAMLSMQTFHQEDQGWADIGYNFAVGGDGLVYEGRGWDKVGAHAPSYNVKSIGIVLIGHFVSELPPPRQLESAKKLIQLGLDLGYISPSYSLVGHRQVRATECPGTALFNEISIWNHFDHSIVFEGEDKK